LKFNTKVNLKNWHEKMIKESSNSPALEGLEESWKLLDDYYNNSIEDVVDRSRIVQTTPLSAFRYMIEAGFYPPPEVLLALDDCFEMYMAQRGKVELEQIFFGDKKRGVGNYAAQTYKERAYNHLRAELSINSAFELKIQIEVAESVIELFKLTDDVDSFLRGYRRYVNSLKKKTSDT
jgi:hypothetical protein